MTSSDAQRHGRAACFYGVSLACGSSGVFALGVLGQLTTRFAPVVIDVGFAGILVGAVVALSGAVGMALARWMR